MCRLCGENTRKLFWLDDEDIVEYGIYWLSHNTLCSDNSGGEYGASKMIIKYCPLCGREL